MPATLMELMRHEYIKTTMAYYVGRNARSTAAALWDAHNSLSTTLGTTSTAGRRKPLKTSESDGTRTRNHRIDSRMVTSKSGDDNIAEGNHLRQKPLAAWATRAAEIAADLAGNGVIEPDLTTWLHTCPIPLDDAQRDAIRAIVGE